MTGSAPEHADETGDEDLPWPVGFMLLVAAAGLYLLWRAIQVVGWIVDHIT